MCIIFYFGTCIHTVWPLIASERNQVVHSQYLSLSSSYSTILKDNTGFWLFWDLTAVSNFFRLFKISKTNYPCYRWNLVKWILSGPTDCLWWAFCCRLHAYIFCSTIITRWFQLLGSLQASHNPWWAVTTAVNMTSTFAFAEKGQLLSTWCLLIGSLVQPIGYSCFVGIPFLPKIIRNLIGFGPSKEKFGKPLGLSSIGKSTTSDVWIRCTSQVRTLPQAKS